MKHFQCFGEIDRLVLSSDLERFMLFVCLGVV